MKTVDLPITMLLEAVWNANKMDPPAIGRLAESVRRFGLVQPLVVRPITRSSYEVINGNQRLRVLQDAAVRVVPCVIVDLDDAGAMLLAEALNGIHGEDDLALKGALLKKVLAAVSRERVLSLLPETANSLQALSAIGEDDLAEHLEAWQKAQAARLRHMQLQLSNEQLDTVEQAIDMVMAKAKNSGGTNPNIRGTAVYLLAKYYLRRHRKQ